MSSTSLLSVKTVFGIRHGPTHQNISCNLCRKRSKNIRESGVISATSDGGRLRSMMQLLFSLQDLKCRLGGFVRQRNVACLSLHICVCVLYRVFDSVIVANVTDGSNSNVPLVR